MQLKLGRKDPTNASVTPLVFSVSGEKFRLLLRGRHTRIQYTYMYMHAFTCRYIIMHAPLRLVHNMTLGAASCLFETL